jgi:hypothetical protein
MLLLRSKHVRTDSQLFEPMAAASARRVLAHRYISLPHGKSIAFGANRTSGGALFNGDQSRLTLNGRQHNWSRIQKSGLDAAGNRTFAFDQQDVTGFARPAPANKKYGRGHGLDLS